MSLLSAVPSTPICSKRYIWYNLRSGVIYLFIYLFFCFFVSLLLWLESCNTRHKSLKQEPFVLNFLQISYIHASHLCSHSNVPLSFPNVEPRVFWLGKRQQRPGREHDHSQMSPRAKAALAERDWFPTKVNF